MTDGLHHLMKSISVSMTVVFAAAAAALMIALPFVPIADECAATSVVKGEAAMSYDFSVSNTTDFGKLYDPEKYVNSISGAFIRAYGFNIGNFQLDVPSITVTEAKMKASVHSTVNDNDMCTKKCHYLEMTVTCTFSVLNVGEDVMTTDTPGQEVYGADVLKAYLPAKTAAGDKLTVSVKVKTNDLTDEDLYFEKNDAGIVSKDHRRLMEAVITEESTVAYLVGGSDTAKKEFRLNVERNMNVFTESIYDFGSVAFADVRNDTTVSDTEVINQYTRNVCKWTADGRTGEMKRAMSDSEKTDVTESIGRADDTGAFAENMDVSTGEIHYFPTSYEDSLSVLTYSDSLLLAAGVTDEASARNVLGQIGTISSDVSESNSIYNSIVNAMVGHDSGKSELAVICFAAVLAVGAGLFFFVRKRP